MGNGCSNLERIFSGPKTTQNGTFLLRTSARIGTLLAVKNWPYILIALIVVAGAAYLVYSDRQRLGLGHLLGANSASENAGLNSEGNNSENPSPTAALNVIKPSQIEWRSITRAADGFNIDLPAGPKNTEAPAFNETGGTESVNMLESSPDGDTVYALTWQDNPPVARANNNLPDRTLDQARDGMLARTQTTLMSESRILSGGFPGREILAHNSQGGILNARLIYVQASGAKDRLYTLLALFPTAGARNEQDVRRFFTSFVMAVPKT
jgi:hypothetical protein